MSDEQRPNQSGLVPSSSHALTTHSSALVRRGLEALRTQQTRVLRFPPDRSMGILYVPRRSYYEELESWEARGNVTVPTEKKLTLDISDEASADLSPFAALAPDDLQALSLAHSSVSNVELRHIGKLTGLQELDLHNEPRWNHESSRFSARSFLQASRHAASTILGLRPHILELGN